jgi:hypothetical protein
MIKIQTVQTEWPGLPDHKDEGNALLRNVGYYVNVNKTQSQKICVYN